jgi:hypothetical protein
MTHALLDAFASAAPLWAERLEETMKGQSADRRWGFWLADHGLALGGLVLLAVGAATSWWAMSLGWAALAIAFFAWVAEADGLLALPRLGRVAIRTLPPATRSGWSLRGRFPVDDLRFDHHERVVYVTRGSLERSLSVAG